jgi:hypothetical protein
MVEHLLKNKEYKRNEFYLSAGEIEEQIGFITKESFKWYSINEIGDEVNFHFFLNNNFVVEFNSFMSQKPSQMFIEAMEDSEGFCFQSGRKYWSDTVIPTIGRDLAGSFLKQYLLKHQLVHSTSYSEMLKKDMSTS